MTCTDEKTQVFIVEDSVAIQKQLSGILQRLNGVYVIGIADNASEAVERILRRRPQYVILDVHLASGSGLDVLRAVHSVAPCITFIVLTNYPQPQYRAKFLAEGATHFLDKTREFDQVRQIVSKAKAAD
jgi:DNA-binding NtrC family response regulator